MPEAGSPQERLLTETIENVRQLVLTNHTSREDNQETILEVAPSFLPHLTLLGGISHLCNHKDEEKQQSKEEHINKIIALTRILASRLPAALPVQPLSSSPASPCAPLDGCPLYYRCLFLPIQPSSTVWFSLQKKKKKNTMPSFYNLKALSSFPLPHPKACEG